MKTFLKSVLILAGVLVLLLLAALTFSSGPTPPPPMPVPNGFDDLVRAAESIRYLPGKSDLTGLTTTEERHAMIASNTPALELLRAGLAKEIRVPTTNDMASMLPSDQGTALKRLAQLLVLDASVAQDDGNPTNRVDACVDIYDLGTRGTRGGLMFHGMVATAVRSMANKPTSDLLRSDHAATCRYAARKLAQLMTNAPTTADYLANEDAWRRRTPEGGGLRGILFYPFLARGLKPARDRFVQRFDQQRQVEAELLADLAAHAFQLEHNRAATNWTELVPDYLPEIPRNATNNAPLPLIGR